MTGIRLAVLVTAVAALAGCASTASTGVVPIGDGIYMTSKQDYMAWSGGKVKAELFQEAASFCGKQGKKPIPVNDSSQDAGMYSYASAEVKFRCA